MTKSTITDKRVTSVIERLEHYACNLKWTNVRGAQDLLAAADGLRELQERRKADSEPVEMPIDYLQGHKDGLEWAAQLAEANHPETGDWLYDDPIELAKAIRKGPDMPPVQPVADSEPDRNPVLAYADSYRDMAKQGVESVPIWSVITDLERNIAPLYRHAQQAVVPDDVLEALQKVARIRLDMNDFDGDRRGIADCLGDAEEALIEVVNRRAAMLAAAPQSPGSEPATVPGTWIPVSERMPEDDDFVYIWPRPDFGVELHVGQYCECSPKGDGWYAQVYEQNYGIEWHPITVTHWMPLPSAPQEVK